MSERPSPGVNEVDRHEALARNDLEWGPRGKGVVDGRVECEIGCGRKSRKGGDALSVSDRVMLRGGEALLKREMKTRHGPTLVPDDYGDRRVGCREEDEECCCEGLHLAEHRWLQRGLTSGVSGERSESAARRG